MQPSTKEDIVWNLSLSPIYSLPIYSANKKETNTPRQTRERERERHGFESLSKCCMAVVPDLLCLRSNLMLSQKNGQWQLVVRTPFVVFFDQRLGAAHSKCRLKYAFSCFGGKIRKKQENWGKIEQKNVVFEFAPRRW